MKIKENIMSWLNKLKEIAKSVTPCRYVSKKSIPAHIKPTLEPIHKSLLYDLERKRDRQGWVLHDCDAMLWQGLYGAVTKEKTTIFAAMEDSGLAYRQPKKDCLATRKSKSSWSRDMMVGMLTWCLHAKNSHALDLHFAYGQKHKWRMGFGPVSRTLYTPQIVSLLDQVRFHIKGKPYPKYKKIPYIFSSGLVDYQAHLQVLVVLIIGEMYGKIPAEAFKRLEEHYKRSKRNPLYAAAMLRYGGAKYATAAISACTSPVFDSSVRSNNQKVSEDAERLYAISLILQ